MDKFSQILKELCKENNITIKELSKITGITDSLLYKYANQKTSPTIDNIVKLANYFNCSIDYMLGDDSFNYGFNQTYNKSLFYNRFKDLLKKYNLKSSNISNKLQISKSTQYCWKNGTMPYLDTLVKIAKYFDVSVDYLIGRSDS